MQVSSKWIWFLIHPVWTSVMTFSDPPPWHLVLEGQDPGGRGQEQWRCRRRLHPDWLHPQVYHLPRNQTGKQLFTQSSTKYGISVSSFKILLRPYFMGVLNSVIFRFSIKLREPNTVKHAYNEVPGTGKLTSL